MPGIVNTIIVILILRMGSILSNGFEQIFLLYNPLIYEVADVFETYTYRVGIREGPLLLRDRGRASSSPSSAWS